ncbi:MAG: phospholipase D family protein [Gammaproteobacteria bacterium]|nr:phospholipase D family protein [Gammaproteobacteria bacterium]MDH3371862.1 phospholipase D family protein [Gammaproteobacteria bacterium]MDH3407809.1 phospholipase D family protein [Gammaproteobacteria bacterium]
MTSHAFTSEETSGSRLGRALHGLAEQHPGKAGFLTVSDGVDALAIRLLLADHAEYSIDAQYYEIENDLAGHLFIEALLRAAERGVRIRLLLDDYGTKGHDEDIAALRAHPNFRMRIYNPFTRRIYRFIDGVLSFARVNRRMHNKSFTVDNQLTIVGGRNIGDHYFSVGEDVNFADLDVIGIGPVVSDVSRMFDSYWNSQAAIPVQDMATRLGLPDVSLSKLVDRMSKSHARASESKYAGAVKNSMIENLEHDLSEFIWAPYELAFDLPEKTQPNRSNSGARIRKLLVQSFDNAREEVILISPYFVPRLSGIRRFRELRKRGVEVTIVTNSLASNNQIYAHGGYAPVRKALLQMGVRLFELRADALVVGEKHKRQNATRATLHTKAFAIDRERIFIGSFNFDPRSANINTEMGVFIDSSQLANAFIDSAKHHVPRQSYEVKLSANGRLRWHGIDGDTEVVLDREPQAGFWHRCAGHAARLLPIRGQV